MPGHAVDYWAQTQLLADIAARAAIIVLFSMMAVRFAQDFAQTGHVTGLFLLISEALVVVLTLMRRTASTVDRSLRARTLTTLSTLGPPLMVPGAAVALVPDALTVALSCAGLCVVIAAKIALGRSFALLPANRGIVSSGLYGFVRHPIYLGYLITHVAFLAASPALWNLVALCVADAALLARAVCEEQTLSQDAQYRDYQTRVRWRVAPGVF
ncbi:MAG TPA: isoprenylcysteine carboxylmethyltransferase family protein [Vicinamibacterales bacterium]|nr:isoprenylcysteine carboxylmethyltransferase family protein [Vicinamibacterales bacterium]